jgi:F-type H+-transporting ATPase subunit b
MLFESLLLAQLWAAPSAHVEEHAASITGIIFPLINFLIFIYLVKRFLMPLAKDYLRSRREEVISAVKGAGEGKRQAEEKVRDYQGRISRLAADAKQIQEALRAEGERERTKVLAEGQEMAVKIKVDAGFLAEQEIKVARQQIRAEIGRVAHEAARKALQGNLTAADQKRLVGEFLTQLGEVK